jgi:predicted RNA-binding protein YlxR (DUF448 family)
VATPSPTKAPADGAAPRRRCIVTRNPAPRAGLLRFVIGPEGEVVPDLAGRLPGRGLWVASRDKVLATAVEKGAFARAARRAVRVPDGLVEQVGAMLARRCVDLLGVARSAGLLTFGFDRVSDMLGRGEAGLVLQAIDGSAGSRGRLGGRLDEVPLVVALTSDELGEAVGRETVVHAAIARGRMAERVAAEARRLEGFRPGSDCGPAT